MEMAEAAAPSCTAVMVVIHVFDEYRQQGKDFACARSVLLREMRYFRAFLTQAQADDEIDISVHCDVEVFAWLVRYMQHRAEGHGDGDGNDSSAHDAPPCLSLDNVASILVSSEFLLMDALVDECLSFISARLQEFVMLRVDFGCLSDATIARLSERCALETLVALNDPKDKIQSKLWRKKSDALVRAQQQSNASVRSCEACGALYSSSSQDVLHCKQGECCLSARGEWLAAHRPKRDWDIETWMGAAVRENTASWETIYWVLWASTQAFVCTTCELHCALIELRDCMHHPGQIIAQDAKYSCCGRVIFDARDPMSSGCSARLHSLPTSLHSQLEAKLSMLKTRWEAIDACRRIRVRAGDTAGSTQAFVIDQGAFCYRPSPPQCAAAALDSLVDATDATAMEAASPRRREHWQAMRHQEDDQQRIHALIQRIHSIQTQKGRA